MNEFKVTRDKYLWVNLSLSGPRPHFIKGSAVEIYSVQLNILPLFLAEIAGIRFN